MVEVYGSDTEISFQTIVTLGVVMDRMDWVTRKAKFFNNPELEVIRMHEQAWCERAKDSFGLSGKLCVIYSKVSSNGEVVKHRADVPITLEDGLSNFVGFPVTATVQESSVGAKTLEAYEV